MSVNQVVIEKDHVPVCFVASYSAKMQISNYYEKDKCVLVAYTTANLKQIPLHLQPLHSV